MPDRRPSNPSSGRGADAAAFLRGVIAAPKRTGAIAPSGRQLARLMAAQLDPAVPGMVVELGPGTGVFTTALIERGFEPERLVLIEFNPEFCALLRSRFAGARIIEGDAYDVARHVAEAGLGAPAAIISGLPLLNFPPDRRVELIRRCLALGAPGMPYVQFSYGIGPPVPAGDGIEVSPPHRAWLNFPPAAVWVYRHSNE